MSCGAIHHPGFMNLQAGFEVGFESDQFAVFQDFSLQHSDFSLCLATGSRFSSLSWFARLSISPYSFREIRAIRG
jgi:hypothetical protein